jgi:BirA family transcriptional regulator, biotin operon repressor / biotin---[acetyl-CoA-carboxylase] ligase
VRLDARAGAVDVALRRPDRDAGDPRDLGVGEAEGIAQHDDRALLGGEPGERLGQVAAQVGERGQPPRIGILVRGRLLEQRLRLSHALERDAVPTGVHDETVEPGRKLSIAAKLPQAGAKLDQRFLRGVASIFEVTEELRRKALHLGRVALDERVERAAVAARGLAHELSVAQALVPSPDVPIPLVQTGLDFDRLHGRVSVVAVDAPDSLAPEVVEPLLTGRFGRPYLYEDACESSQRLLGPDLGEGAVAVCDVQTGGRGRLGRPWEAPPRSAILCSVLLQPPPERTATELSLVGGLATAEAVERALGLAVQIKWPNDVMLNRRKVAGVLAEAAGAAVVLGIGLNVNQSREELPGDATVAPASLYTTDGVQRPRAPILVDLLGVLEDLYGLWREGGLDSLYDTLGARDFLRGRRIYIDGEPGLGIAIDRSGRLEVEIDGARRLVESGEVRFER